MSNDKVTIDRTWVQSLISGVGWLIRMLMDNVEVSVRWVGQQEEELNKKGQKK
jgi:hypothetical protein